MGTTEVRGDSVRPTAVACPGCGTAFAWPPTGPCVQCGADLTGPAATAIFDIDRQADALRRERASRVEELRGAARQPRTIDLPPPAMPPAPGAPPTAPGRSSIRPQLLLAGAGAALLLAAVIVFIAVTWPTWPATAQMAFVAALTALGAVVARDLARRELPATADAIGVLTIGIATYSLLAAHAEGLAGLDRIDTRLWVALVATGAAVVARPLTTWAGLRDAPRRVAVVAAVVAGTSTLLWLAATDVTAPSGIAALAAAPTAAVLLLLHGRWVLRPDDGFRIVLPAVPAILLAGTAGATGLVTMTAQATVAIGIAAAVGLPLLIWARRTHPTNVWTYGGAVLATLWAVQLVTFLTTDVVDGPLGLDAPRLVAFSVTAAVAVVAARFWQPPDAWRDPILLAGALAAVPAVGWTVAVWAPVAAVLAEVLATPFEGWPPSDALTTADLLLAGAALALVTVAVERVQRSFTVPFLVAGTAGVVVAATISAAAGGVLPAAGPLLVAVGLAVAAGWWWERRPATWAPVVVAHVGAIVLASVDQGLFAATTAAAAAHLAWVATRRSQPLTAAAATAAGLLAVAATSDLLTWPTTTTTLLVTALAATLLVWAQLTDSALPWRHGATDAVVAMAAVIATGVALDLGATTTAAMQLAIIAVAAAVHAARPGRGWAVWLSSATVSLAVWTLLGDRGVEVIEAYTLPAAGALVAAGAWRLHVSDTSSWAALWPACTMASLPTLALLFDGPDTVRVLLLATGAVAVALTGHWRGLAAPLATGTVVAVAAAVLQLHYWTLPLPRWVAFGVLGLALIAASATYEAQLRRARRVRQHLRRLR